MVTRDDSWLLEDDSFEHLEVIMLIGAAEEVGWTSDDYVIP